MDNYNNDSSIREILIEDCSFKTNINDSDILVIEDEEDTKQTSVAELKKNFNGDDQSPSNNKFYSSDKVDALLYALRELINEKASKTSLDNLSTRVSDIIVSNPDGSKDNEIVDARDGAKTLNERLCRDTDIVNGTKLEKISIPVIETIREQTYTITVPKGFSIGLVSIIIDYDDSSLSGQILASYDKKEDTRNISYPKSKYDYIVSGDTIAITHNIQNAIMTIYYNAYNVDTLYLYNELIQLKQQVNNQLDHCGLVTDYGTSFFFDKLFDKEPDSWTVHYKNQYKRNGHDTLEMHIKPNSYNNPYFSIRIEPTKFQTVMLNFYLNKETLTAFSGNDAIDIFLSSEDIVTTTNYLVYTISSGDLNNGWNHIKKHIDDFTVVGNPDYNRIKSIKIRVYNESLGGKSIYFNSITFNQVMKPTLLLCFNGTYERGFNYTYPYLYARDIPFTLFINDGTTLTNEEKIVLSQMIFKKGCEVSTYGCHPNKELLIEEDNAYEQYKALVASKKYITDNFYNNPVSFSVPYGDLTNLTKDILRNLDYKIFRVEANNKSLCGFFSNDDNNMPVIKINNSVSIDDVKNQIETAIKTGQAISIFTNNVTEYGNESDIKQVVFEQLIEFIISKVNEDQLQCMTYKDFYHACVSK